MKLCLIMTCNPPKLAIAVIVCLFMTLVVSTGLSADIAVIAADGTQTGTIPVQAIEGIERLSLTYWSMLLDAELDWDYVTGTADMRFRDHHLRFADKSQGIWINGRMHSLPGRVIQQDGDIWIPTKILDDLVDALWEGDVIWHNDERELRRYTIRPRITDIRRDQYIDDQWVIVLDPGHGGADTGCMSRDGALEKDVVLAIVNRVADIVANRLGAHVELTRTTDMDVSFEERIAKANGVRADVFISLHIAPPDEMPGRSFHVYALPEGRVELESDVKPALWESRSRETIEMTRSYAQEFASGMVVTANMKDYAIQSRELKILKGLAMPAFVLELSWDSSFYGHITIGEEAGANRAAEAVFDGIRAFLETE